MDRPIAADSHHPIVPTLTGARGKLARMLGGSALRDRQAATGATSVFDQRCRRMTGPAGARRGVQDEQRRVDRHAPIVCTASIGVVMLPPMERWLSRMSRVGWTAAVAFVGVSAVQFVRVRRMEFLSHPRFWINHVVQPAAGLPSGRPPQPLRFVVLGDSIAAGVGVDRAEESLPYLLAQRLADARRRPVHVVNYGAAGARADTVRRFQLPRAMEPLRRHETEPFLPAADAVAVVIGCNDAMHLTSPTRFREDLRAILDGIRSAAPAATVVLAGIPVFRGVLRQVEPLIWLADQYARLLRPISRAEAQRAGAAFADLAAELRQRLTPDPDPFARDRFHPSAAGYTAWADVIATALLEGRPIEPEAPASGRTQPAGT